MEEYEAKYIILVDNSVIVFSTNIGHNEINVPNKSIVSAGFIDKNYNATGGSITLKKVSRPEDSEIIRNSLFRIKL